MKILITGANGFLGRAARDALVDSDHDLCSVIRNPDTCQLSSTFNSKNHPKETVVSVGAINGTTDWSKALNGVDAVLHLAARVHIIRESVENPLAAFREVNLKGTERLARSAASRGVRRFIYISSVGIHGNRNHGHPFTEKELPAPYSPYTLSKWEGELALAEIADNTGLEVVVIRSPLIYGPNNPGNFLRLLRLVDKGIPLPLGAIKNRRSMIYVGNLVDAIIACLEHPKAAGETFLVSDGVDVSTPQLIRMIAAEMKKNSRLVPVPPALLKLLGKVAGKSAEVERLTGSLCVDSGKIRTMLNWKPPFSMEEGIKETVEWFSAER